MLFDNIFSFANEGAKSCEDISQNLSNKIPGASPSAKIVREESPEVQAVLDFISNLTGATQQTASKQNAYANDPGATSQAASSAMKKSSESLQFADLIKETQQAKQTAQQTEPK
jgi:hypothetical protein